MPRLTRPTSAFAAVRLALAPALACAARSQRKTIAMANNAYENDRCRGALARLDQARVMSRSPLDRKSRRMEVECSQAIEDPFRIPRIACALLAALTLVTASCGDSRRSDQLPPMEAAELVERVRANSAPLILDVRTHREYAAAHIPGAVNIPHDTLPRRLDELGDDKTIEVVVYCWTGARAGLAEDVLARAGYTNVRDLEGHMRAWRRARYPTTQ